MKEQVIAWATEVWQTSHWTNEQIKRLERFYDLVRNAALDEAVQKCRSATASIWDYHDDGRKEIGTTVCNNLAAAIESLKEPTP